MDILKTYRLNIDELDNLIIKYLEERIIISSKIGRIKKQNSLNIEDEIREREIIEKLKKRTKYLSKEDINKLYDLIFKISKNIQY